MWEEVVEDKIEDNSAVIENYGWKGGGCKHKAHVACLCFSLVNIGGMSSNSRGEEMSVCLY